MINVKSFIFVLFFVVQTSTAQAGFLTWARRTMGLKVENYCSTVPQEVTSVSANILYSRGKSYLQQKNYCEAHRYFFEFLRQNPLHEERREVWLLLVESLFRAGDYVLAINEANDFIFENLGTPDEEKAHYWIVQSVAAQFGSAKHSQKWVEYALGLGDGQNKALDYINRLEFQSFLQRFPNSTYIEKVLLQKKQAHDLYAAHYFEVGMYYFKKNEMKAALGRFMVILKTASESPSFEPAVYFAYLSFKKFAQQLRSQDLSLVRVRELLELKNSEVINWQDHIQEAENSAKLLKKLLLQKKPNSPFLQKMT